MEKGRGSMVLIKRCWANLGCSNYFLREQPQLIEFSGTQAVPLISLPFFSLCLCFALFPMKTCSLLLRPQPANPKFSVDLLCSHLLKLHLTWRLGSEISMWGENCWLVIFPLKVLEITGKWGEMLTSCGVCGNRDPWREHQIFSFCCRAFAHNLHY